MAMAKGRGLLDLFPDIYSRAKVAAPAVVAPAPKVPAVVAPVTKAAATVAPAPKAASAASAVPAGAMSFADWESGRLNGLPDFWGLKAPTAGLASIAKAIGYGGKQIDQTGNIYMGEGESGPMYQPGYGVSADLKKALEGYSFVPVTQGNNEHPALRVYGKDGSYLGEHNIADSGSKSRDMAAKLAIGAIIGGGALNSAGAFGAAGGASGGTGFTLGGAGAGIAPLTAVEALAPLTAAEVSAAGLGASGSLLGGGAGLLGAGIGAGEGAAQLAASMAANPLTAGGVASATLPAAGLPGLEAGLLGSGFTLPKAGAGIDATAETLGSLADFTAANPITPAELSGTLPKLGAGFTLPGAGSGIPPMTEMPAASPVTPADMASTLPSAGALTPSVPTSLIDAIKSGGSSAYDFLKGNKELAKALFGIGTGLLAGADSGGGGGAAPVDYGPAKEWTSPLQMGLLGQSQMAQPLNLPRGLLAGGQANDGAWRYLMQGGR